jgi:CubicO group peptidase (beta-lactamase class C family)
MATKGRIFSDSVTKPWTVTAIMQAKEASLIDIDAPISKYVDPILRRLNSTTMDELWGHDPIVSHVIARRLMGMRAGLRGYNDTWY